MSFAYLVYASAWLKRYHPAAFCAALLNAQPMGFYSPQSLVDDARRHGVEVRRPDINASDAKAVAGVHQRTPAGAARAGEPPHAVGAAAGRSCGWGCPRSARSATTWPSGSRRSASADGPYRGHARPGPAGHGLTTAQLEALATADAFAVLRPDPARGAVGGRARRRRSGPTGCRARSPATDAPMLPGMDEVDALVADVWATGLSPDSHPAQFVREHLDRSGAVPIARLPALERRPAGAGRRHRHPPAAPGHRGRDHVPQPRGRDRHAQRHLLAGAVAALPEGGPHQRGAGGARPAGEGRGGDQPGRRPARRHHATGDARPPATSAESDVRIRPCPASPS